MAILHNLKYVIHAIIIFQCLFLAVILWTRRNRRRPHNLLLAAFLLAKAISELGGVTSHFQDLHRALLAHFPQLLLAYLPFEFLYVPLLFFYCSAFTRKPFRFKTQDLLHLVPFLTVWAFLIAGYYVKGAGAIRTMAAAGPLIAEAPDFILSTAAHLQFFAYALASLLLLKRYRSEIKNTFSTIERIDLSWLRFVMFGFIGWRSLLVVEYGLWQTTNLGISIFLYLLAEILFLAFVSVMFVSGMKQPEIFIAAAPNDGRKYEKTFMTLEARDLCKNKLLQLMKTQKPYLDPGLNLNNLADRAGMLPYQLSQVLNSCFNQNFFDFINSYRVEESKRFLDDPRANGRKIIQILYETGFNSKSVFNSAFKKHTGMTPSQFKKSRESPAPTAE